MPNVQWLSREGECAQSDSSSDNTSIAPIVGAVVAVVFVFVIAVTIIAIALILKSHRGDMCIKKTDE